MSELDDKGNNLKNDDTNVTNSTNKQDFPELLSDIHDNGGRIISDTLVNITDKNVSVNLNKNLPEINKQEKKSENISSKKRKRKEKKKEKSDLNHNQDQLEKECLSAALKQKLNGQIGDIPVKSKESDDHEEVLKNEKRKKLILENQCKESNEQLDVGSPDSSIKTKKTKKRNHKKNKEETKKSGIVSIKSIGVRKTDLSPLELLQSNTHSFGTGEPCAWN